MVAVERITNIDATRIDNAHRHTHIQASIAIDHASLTVGCNHGVVMHLGPCSIFLFGMLPRNSQATYSHQPSPQTRKNRASHCIRYPSPRMPQSMEKSRASKAFTKLFTPIGNARGRGCCGASRSSCGRPGSWCSGGPC